MPAPAGNLNAEKWTIDHTHHLLDRMEDLIDEDGIHYLGQALGLCNAYAELWSRLRKKWKDDEDITHRMKVIEQRYESRVVCGSLTGRYKASAARLVLKHYHGFEPPEVRVEKRTLKEELEEIIADVEAVTGPLDERMKTHPYWVEVIRKCHGGTMEQMTAAGLVVRDGYIYPPEHPRLKINDEYHMF